MGSEVKQKIFKKDNGMFLPVNSEKYLMPFLSPTTIGSHYRCSSPKGDVTSRQKGRILLQIHQLLHLFQEYGIDLKGKTMLDIGTGNGLVPCMVLELSGLASAIGVDPYLDGEHMTSWQVHDHNKAFMEIKSFLKKHCKKNLDYSAYRHLLTHENYSMIPGNVIYKKQPSKPYRFEKISAYELNKLEEKFDIIYCKAIEHISCWDKVFESASQVSNDDAIFYLKHRSFFSYLGAHRYASVSIPWGQVLLTQKEYERFIEMFYVKDAAKMKDFYYNGLAYPRLTVSDMVRIARKYGFVMLGIVNEPTRHIDKVCHFVDDVEHFWDIVFKNHPRVSAEEIFSGMYHILFRKTRV